MHENGTSRGIRAQRQVNEQEASRSESENGHGNATTPARRVRRRLGRHSPTSKQTPNVRREDENSLTDQSRQDEMDVRKLELMERRLDFDIMTQSEEGLSTEAVEYLRLQRQLILEKARLLSQQRM